MAVNGALPMKYQFTFHVTLLTILLFLVISTTLAFGYIARRNALRTADSLGDQVLDQTALYVDDKLNDLLVTANYQDDLNAALLNTGQFRVDDFGRLAAYWLQVMKTHPELTRMSLGVEATGEWYYVRRPPTERDRLLVGELRRNPTTGRLDQKDYRAEDYPRVSFSHKPGQDDEDPRQRQWYVAARAAGKQVWSESYVFYGAEGIADAPGVSCATPLFRPDGSLLGALTASFDLEELCQYLHTLQVGRGEGGYTFVVEYRADGSRRVIAHPRPEILLHQHTEGGRPRRELVPVEALDDPVVQAFLGQVPPSYTPDGQQGGRRVAFKAGGVKYLGSYRCLSGEDTPNWLICTLLPEAEVMADVHRSNLETVLIGLAIFLLIGLLSLIVARKMAGPLEQLGKETAAVGSLQLESRPVVPTIVLEIHRLAVAVEEMKAGLRSFQKYVPADLVRSILASGHEAALGGEQRTVTVLFTDIADFTATSEGMAPEKLVENLREYLSGLSDRIVEAGGTVDKYVGDAVMAFWNAPSLDPRHALGACTAAVRCQQWLESVRPGWTAEGKPPFVTRIGVNTGEVVVGNIGSEARLNYTVIGDAVNLASRLEALNKYYGTGVLVSEASYEAAKEGVVARPLDWVSVKGKTAAVLVYELLGLKGEVGPEVEVLAARYAEALGRYRRQVWPEAIKLFEEFLTMKPGDEPARQMIARCREYQAKPPGEGWDGVHRLSSK